MDKVTEMIVTLGVAITGVAIVALLVSKQSQTPAVIQASGSAFSNALDVAVSPVTLNSSPPNLAYPGQGSMGMMLPNLPTLGFNY